MHSAVTATAWRIAFPRRPVSLVSASCHVAHRRFAWFGNSPPISSTRLFSSAVVPPSPRSPPPAPPGVLGPFDCVLGLESTCDDTGVALVTANGHVLLRELSSELQMQHEAGGVIPVAAALAHETHFPVLTCRVLEGYERIREQHHPDLRIRAVAFSAGPGLSLCLAVGMQQSRELCRRFGVPLLAVNHLEAHALAASLPAPPRGSESISSGAGGGEPDAALPTHVPSALQLEQPPPGLRELRYPYLGLLVSGGHTELWLARAYGDYQILGRTIDDACGEAFDKVARLLGLQEMGWKHPEEAWGASLSRLARTHDEALAGSQEPRNLDDDLAPRGFSFTLPLASQRDHLNFSFAGLKSAVRRRVRQQLSVLGEDASLDAQSHQGSPEQAQAQFKIAAQIAAEFEACAVGHLLDRVRLTLARLPDLGISRSPPGQEQHLDDERTSAQPKQPPLQLVLCGGVAGNRYLRRQLQRLVGEHIEGRPQLELLMPAPAYCGDNGVNIAWAGVQRLHHTDGRGVNSLETTPTPSWPVGVVAPLAPSVR